MHRKPAAPSLEVVDPPIVRHSRHNRHDLNAKKIVRLYLKGISELEIARRFGVSRQVIRRRLEEAKTPIRGRGAAMLVRMSRASPADRKRWSAAAHEAARGRKMSVETKRLIARSKTRRKGPGEALLLLALGRMGWKIEEQAPIDIYNVDLLVEGRVAVEPTMKPGTILRTRQGNHLERSKHLLSRGVSTLWVTYGDLLALGGCLNEVIAHADELRSLPAGRSEYRVIRCTAYRSTIGRNQMGQLASVPTPIRFECRRVQ